MKFLASFIIQFSRIFGWDETKQKQVSELSESEVLAELEKIESFADQIESQKAKIEKIETQMDETSKTEIASLKETIENQKTIIANQETIISENQKAFESATADISELKNEINKIKLGSTSGTGQANAGLNLNGVNGKTGKSEPIQLNWNNKK